MNFTLHVTADCDLDCRYCYEKHTHDRMSVETAKKAVDLMLSFGHKINGFSFFGGEPLLCRELIAETVRYAARLSEGTEKLLRYRMTTNGTQLDEDFLSLADEHHIAIALSHDGVLQDIQRVDRAGRGTAARLEPKIDMLLAHQPDAIAMMTVLPENVSRFAEAFRWLYERGFTHINTAIDYRPGNHWDDASMEELDRQYALVADYCEAHYDGERPLRYLNFESKIASYLEGRPCIECRLGMKQPSIAPDGSIYPCNQFLNLAEYRMGDVTHGIDAAAQRRIYEASLKEEPSCRGCALEKRCRHHCACLNFSMTGDMHEVPPLQCVHEQSVIKNADRMAAKLYERRSPGFMKAYGKKSK